MTTKHRVLRPGAAAVAAFLTAAALVQAAPAYAAPTPKTSTSHTANATKAGSAAPMGHTSRSVLNQPAPEDDSSDPTAQALRQAASTGKPVTINSLTNTGTLVQANPNGTLTRTLTSMPQRVEQNGTWVPVNTALSLRNGVLAPAATTTAVTFSPGGTTTLATLGSGTDSLGFTWPTALPTPVITGSTATYPNVLPDVDLQLTANASGYSSVLVLKTPAAAKDPQLQDLSLGTTAKNVTLSTTSDGGTQAVDSATKQVVFHSDTALMWDSSPAATASSPAAGTASTAGATADLAKLSATARVAAADSELQSAQQVGAHQARIGVSLQKGRQFLSLNKALLSAKSTKYPVFVDPEWTGNPSQLDWARISDNGDNVYNSTATSGDANAREGWDDNDPGNGERARTYYQVSTGFVAGATISAATLSVTQLSAASCSATPATVFGTAYPGGWNSSGLYWGHEPALQTGELGTPPTSEEAGVCPVTNGTGSYVSPPDLSFNVLSRVQSAAEYGWNSMTLMVESVNMNDATQWKELGYGGGARLSITYSFAPQMTAGTGEPKLSPVAADFGQNVTWTHTPTISATAYEHTGDPELLRMDYHVYNSAGTQVAYNVATTYSVHGAPYTVPSLPDGTYTWKSIAENASNLWASAWTPTQTFTINTSAPTPPAVSSPEFPANQIGARYGSTGVFTLGNDHSNTVVGYMFSLGGDLSSSTYSTSVPKLTSTTTIAPKTTYFAAADNANGTGTAISNGIATLDITVPSDGPNTLYVKAVNNAGTNSAETSYLFYAGTSTPTYAYGNQMVLGYTATDGDVVPPATTTSTGGHLITQTAWAGVSWADDQQGMLANNTTASTKVASGDTATFSFDIPYAGSWDIGASLTEADDYGTYNLTLDANGKNPALLTATPFDAYSPFVTNQYEDFGWPVDENGNPILLTQGLHTLTLTLTGKDASSAGYQAGIDVLRLAPELTCTISDTSGCRNNTAFSTYTASPAAVTTADADGGGKSFNEPDLSAVGWPTNSGVTSASGSGTSGDITVDGASIALPNLGTGKYDNMLASGQTVAVPTTGTVNSGDALVFLAFATYGASLPASGQITYTPNKSCSSSQGYTLDSVPDWATGATADAAVTLPHRNANNNTQSSTPLHIYAISVPLNCPGVPISSISLPVQSDGVQANTNSLHIVGLGIRSSTWASGSSYTGPYTSTWEAANDDPAVTNKAGTASATVADQTLRIPAHVSIGTDSNNEVRIHLSNAAGYSPVTINTASIALQDPVALGANTTGTVVPLTFGGSTQITLAAGADTLSDPVSLAVNPQATLLISLDINGSMSEMAGHGSGQSPVYISAANSGNATTNTGSAYTTADIGGIPYLSAVDVSSAASGMGALLLYGDQTVNSDTASGDGQSHLSDDIANAMVADTNGDQQVDYAVLNGGTNSWNSSNNLLPGGSTPIPGSAPGPLDRNALEQANVDTVLISSGTSDLLACPSTGTVAACVSAVEGKLSQLAGQISDYYNDGQDPSSGATPTAISVYIATIPPSATPLTGIQEQAREQINTDLLSQTTAAECGTAVPGSNLNADGVIDFASAVSSDGSATDATSNTVKTADLSSGYPDDQYYTALANAYITDVTTLNANGVNCMVNSTPN